MAFVTVRAHHGGDHAAWASAWARILREGDVLVLTGDLGAGKTQLTKGMAAAWAWA